MTFLFIKLTMGGAEAGKTLGQKSKEFAQTHDDRRSVAQGPKNRQLRFGVDDNLGSGAAGRIISLRPMAAFRSQRAQCPRTACPLSSSLCSRKTMRPSGPWT